MKLRYINPQNVAHLVPEWILPPFFVARNLDELLSEQPWMRPRREFDPRRPTGGLDYWIQAKPRVGAPKLWDFAVSGLDDDAFAKATDQERARLAAMIGMLRITLPDYEMQLPLTCIFRGAPKAEGAHTLYRHSMLLKDAPADYVGITRRTWWERMAEHRSAAARGSNLLFHRAIRQYGGIRVSRIEHAGLSYDMAMEWEEYFTDAGMLYPHGLNMIPGGLAGLRYLATLGHRAKTLDERDAALTTVMERDRLEDGSPNPLCAARWASDQEYVNSVICGHSGRLGVAQVRNIRMLSASGYGAERIATAVNDSVVRVRRVLENRRYSRVI